MYLGKDTATQVEPQKLRKVALAKRVGTFLCGKNPPAELDAVTALANLLARDVETSVRAMLAFELRTSTQVPKDLAIKIAKDIEDVASPFLQETPVLTDEDFAELVPALREFARSAIARRDDLGTQTIDALITNGGKRSVTDLARNKNIKMTQDHLIAMIERFDSHTPVLDALARRVDLPMMVVESLVSRISSAASGLLVKNYGLSASVATEATQRARLSTLFEKMRKSSKDQVRAFVTDLRAENRLDETLILKAAEAKVIVFVEAAIALEAGITVGNARSVLKKGVSSKVVPLLRDAGIARENMADMIRLIEECYRGK